MQKTKDLSPDKNNGTNICKNDPNISLSLTEIIGTFKQVSSQHVYIFDYNKRTLLPDADSIEGLSEENIDTLIQNYIKGINFINRQPVNDRRNYSVSCWLYGTNNRQHILSYHRLTPLTFSKNGTVRLALCTASLATASDSAKLSVTDHNTNTTFEYSGAQHGWKEKKPVELSSMEKEVLTLSAQGHTISEIAGMIYKSVDSVKSCKRSIFKKIGRHKITEAVIYAQNHNLI